MSTNEPPVNEGAPAAEAQASDGAADAVQEQNTPEKSSANGNDRIKAEMAKLMEEAQVNLDGWKRERAEFANYKRRVEQQQRDTYANASADVLKKVIPIVDDFDRAVANIPADLAGNPWVSGTSMIQKKMTKLLEEFGVSLVDPLGQQFDPNLHEAVITEPSEQESGTIVEVLQKGYQVGDRVLRPALVKVAQ